MDLKVSNQHSFELTTFMSFTYCDICSKLLWGVSKQGYTCISTHIFIYIYIYIFFFFFFNYNIIKIFFFFLNFFYLKSI